MPTPYPVAAGAAGAGYGAGYQATPHSGYTPYPATNPGYTQPFAAQAG